MQERQDRRLASDPEREARIAALRERLRHELADNQAYVKRRGLPVAVLIGLAVLFAAASDVGAWYVHYPAGVLLVVDVLILAIYGLSWELPQTPAATREEIELLEQEPHELAQAVELAGSGQPYALFLRSFDAETAGLADYDGRIDLIAQMEADHRAQSQGLAGVPNVPELFDLAGAWTLQASLLRALAERLPTVLLGDKRLLEREARSGAAFEKATRILLVSEAWWPAFAMLAEHARAIVVFVDAPSCSLLREISHLRHRKIKFLCVQKQNACEEAGAGTIAYQDYASFDLAVFERRLDETLYG